MVPTEAHKAQIVRILNGQYPGLALCRPTMASIKPVSCSLTDIYRKSTCRRRMVRCALTMLIEEGLVVKTQKSVNAASGFHQQELFRLNVLRAEDLLPYLDFESLVNRPIRTG
jgi:hypothetical protein